MVSGGIVAVVFSDVVSSTELWSHLGDTVAESVRHRHHDACVQAVESAGGLVVKNLGDGLMATFPTVSASLDGAVALQSATVQVARAMAVPQLALRVGISLGEATREGDD